MDERYTGYGHADTDITRTVIKNNIKIKFIDAPEIHLWHKNSVFYKGQELEDFQIQSAINAMKFAIKWKSIDPTTNTICAEVLQKLNVYPSDLVLEFSQLYKKLYGIF